jgi:hypothetical protein
MRRIALLTVLSVSASAAAQSDPYRFEIRVDRPVLEPGEVATIELWAHFDRGRDGAVYGVGTDLLATLGAEGLADFEIFGLPPFGRQLGEPGPEGVIGIGAGQLCFPCADCPPPDGTNPIGVWRATFTAPPADEPIANELRTRTSHYDMHTVPCGIEGVSRLDELVEGSTTITIVPCRADFNGDGVADLFDFLAFFNAFDAGDALADFDFDGALTVFDFLAFQNRFDSGC